MFNLDLEIIKHICFAQIASDYAKYDYDLATNKTYKQFPIKDGRYKLYNYKLKDRHINMAIQLINSHKSNIRYYVTKAYDQHHNASYIIYFLIDGKQISFHGFRKRKLGGMPMHWTRRFDSRDHVIYLINKYKI